jgi:hypothetical protein
MLELVITVCSIVQGANCHSLQPVRLEENTMMIGCMMASQFEGAKWVEEHPNFYITRATCQPAGRFAKL